MWFKLLLTVTLINILALRTSDECWLCRHRWRLWFRRQNSSFASVDALSDGDGNGDLSDAHSSECYYKRCMGCSEVAASSIGMQVQCDLRNIVTPQWAHSLGYEPPVNSAQYAVEYRCLKMISTPDDQTWGQTTDIIRGCIPLAQVETTCAALSAIQKARGQSDVRCRICDGNLCNAANTISTTVILVFLNGLAIFSVHLF